MLSVPRLASVQTVPTSMSRWLVLACLGGSCWAASAEETCHEADPSDAEAVGVATHLLQTTLEWEQHRLKVESSRNTSATTSKGHSLAQQASTTMNGGFIDAGPGCCIREQPQSTLFQGALGTLEDCKQKCLEFADCGWILHGWKGGTDPYCAVWSTIEDCVTIKSGANDCGSSGNDGVHTYKYAHCEDLSGAWSTTIHFSAVPVAERTPLRMAVGGSWSASQNGCSGTIDTRLTASYTISDSEVNLVTAPVELYNWLWYPNGIRYTGTISGQAGSRTIVWGGGKATSTEQGTA